MIKLNLNNLYKLSPLVSKDPQRFYINGIFIDGLDYIGTDGKVLGVYNNHYNDIMPEPVIFNIADFLESNRLTTAFFKKNTNCYLCLEADDTMFISNEKGKNISSVLGKFKDYVIEGAYPEYKKVFPSLKSVTNAYDPSTSLPFDLSLLNKFKLIHNNIKLIQSDGDAYVVLTTDDRFIGIFMPMSKNVIDMDKNTLIRKLVK